MRLRESDDNDADKDDKDKVVDEDEDDDDDDVVGCCVYISFSLSRYSNRSGRDISSEFNLRLVSGFEKIISVKSGGSLEDER